jgi:hypothetical protein
MAAAEDADHEGGPVGELRGKLGDVGVLAVVHGGLFSVTGREIRRLGIGSESASPPPAQPHSPFSLH